MHGFRTGRSLAAVRLLAAAFLLLSFLQLGRSVRAATPASGQVSQTSPQASWDFAAVAQSSPVGGSGLEQTCMAPYCDNYDLTVSLPSDFYTSNPTTQVTLLIHYTWTPDTTVGTDMDVYAFDPNGNESGPGSPDVTATQDCSTSSSCDAYENLRFTNPTPGVWHIRSMCATCPQPTAAHTVATLSFATLTGPPPPPTPGPTDPGFSNYISPKNFWYFQNEASIGDDWSTDNVLFKALKGTNQGMTLKVHFDDSTTPATPTWTDVTPLNSVISVDPILFTDLATHRTFSSDLLSNPVDALGAGCALGSYTDDDGTNWTPSSGCSLPAGSDHETIGGGPYSSNGLPVVHTSYPNAVYYCAQSPAVIALCGRSDDGGLTYGAGVPIYSSPSECSPQIHGHVKVSPDGTVYVPNAHCGATQAVSVSTDNGLTWTVKHIPDSTLNSIGGDPSVGTGANNTVYFGYVDGADQHPKIAVSTDHGDTWSKSIDVGTAFGIQNAEFPAVIAGDDNRAAFAFLGTTTGGNDQTTNFGCLATDPAGTCSGGVWHLYVAFTYDRGQTWKTVDVTPNAPVQRGCIWNSGGNNPCRNLLDFNDITMDRFGRVLVGYNNGCNDACVNSTLAIYRPDCPNGKTGADVNPCDSAPAIARQEYGPGLLSKYDPFHASIQVAGQPTSFTRLGSSSYTVTLTNTGISKWPAGGAYPVLLGAHFAANNGGYPASKPWYTDQRYSLPHDVLPGQSVSFTISVTAPKRKGNYVLEYEMVQQGSGAAGFFPQYVDNPVTVN